jgi:DNA-binding MarR family transcriptional regulator
LVDIVNNKRAMSEANTPPTDQAAALSSFEVFMTLFGSAQQVLKNRMQNEAEQGLGPLHMRALCLCQRNPGGTQQQLVVSMGRDKGQIARLIRELEERQLLERIPDERDRRVWRLAVTPEGEKKCQWFVAIETQLAADMFGGLSAKERGQLEHVLSEIRARITVATEDA